MNRLTALFERKPKKLLNVFCTAGYPKRDSTPRVIQALADHGVDIIEVGMPYSDPLADGPVIQRSSRIALNEGMCVPLLFEQIEATRQKTQVPLLIMGYFNQVMQYGVSEFLRTASDVGVDGLIIPDLPMDVYERHYQSMFEAHQLAICFLITPQTSEDRIRQADRLSTAFVYMVSGFGVTGGVAHDAKQADYYHSVRQMNLSMPVLAGFGIRDKQGVSRAWQYAEGAIIGSSFIQALERATADHVEEVVARFIGDIKPQQKEMV